MVLDARLEVYAQLNGTAVPVISGSTSDSFLEGSGWVLTSGQLVLPGLHTAPIGALCRLSYRSARHSGAMPRPRLRVLRCSPDPMRRTTTVELGCLLSLYMEKAATPAPQDARIDYDSPDYYFVDTASNFVRRGLEGAGIPYSGVPGLGAYILKDWRWSDGYLKKVGEILLAFNYFGYMGPDEVLAFGSVASPGLSGPSLTLADLVDMAPLTGGTRPGSTIYGRGRYYGSPVDTEEFVSPDADDEFRQQGEDSVREWSEDAVFMPKTTPGSGHVEKEEVGFTRSSENYSTFDRFGRLLRQEEITYDHSYNLNSSHPEECASYAARVTQSALDRGRQALEGIKKEVLIGSKVITEYEYEEIESPSWGWESNPEWQTVDTEEDLAYAQAVSSSRVVRQTVSRYVPEMAFRGAAGIKYLYLEPLINVQTGRREGDRLVDIGPGSSTLVMIEQTTTETFYDKPNQTRTVTTRILYGPASQQGASGAAATDLEYANDAINFLSKLMNTSRAEVSNSVSVSREKQASGAGSDNQGKSFSPSVSDTWTQVAVNSFESVADTYQFYDCPVTFALIVGANRQENRITPNLTEVRNIPVPAYAPYSREYAQGFIRDFAIAQNRLAVGFRSGHQITTTIDKLPITAGSCFHLNSSGSMATYRVNGLNVVFDNRQCVLSVDALYWGAAG